ncbi:MAG: hypothetical protein WCP98_07220 [Actinomycetes bacterium]
MIEGAATTMKLEELLAVPPGVVTAILPLVAPVGTVAVIRVLPTTLKAAPVPLKVTLVAPVRPLPLMVTLAPTGPEVGVKLVTAGDAGDDVTAKLVALAAVPPGVATASLPVVAPVGTLAVICVLPTTLKVVADVPLKVTLVAPMKPLPLMVTPVPTGPEVGVKPVTVGA